MATRKAVVQVAHGDLAVTAHVETERLEAHEIESGPEVVRWDRETDQPVVRQRYVKETHEEIEGEPALPSGTVGYRYVNEDGETVPGERVVHVQRTPEGEVERVEKRPTTVLKGEPLPVEKWVDLDDVSRFLVESTYEVWGQEAADEAALQELAEWVEEHRETPMFVWLLQPDFFKTWGVLVPTFTADRESFSQLVKTTRKTVEPDHEMPVLSQSEVEDLIEAAEAGYVEQEVPGVRATP
ncbi:MAG: hypothetical protein ABEJ42_01645 [Halobacteriaceae archaeon]